MAGFDKQIIDTWSPLVEKHIGTKNTYFRYLCCHYFNYLKISKPDISEDILNLKDKISELTSFKREIKKEYLNLLTGRKEYLLDDGRVYDPGSLDVFLNTDELISIFSIEFITHLDPILSRDIKINKILNNDNRE
jgi:hypothetical protein